MMVFRGEARTPRSLHPLEKALLIVTALQLVFLPWAVGGVKMWSQFVTLGLSLIAFGIALVPRQYTEAYAREGEFKLVMWPKLMRFPIFWLGLALLLYMTMQGLNPSWAYHMRDTTWWMEPVDHLKWLPTGMTAPYAEMNALHTIILYAAPWLTACALWVGITRRVTLVGLLATLAVNSGLLAVVGALQKVAGNGKILWFIDPPFPPGFISSFIYKNHGGAYFNLMLSVCSSLMFWYFNRGERTSQRANPAPIFAFVGVLTAVMVLLSQSRAALILMLVFLLISFLGVILRLVLFGTEGQSPYVIGLFAFVLFVFVSGCVWFLNDGRLIQGLERLANQDYEASVVMRKKAAEATWVMAKDNLVTGWGAGSFRHYFPVYQQRYPEIYVRANGRGWYWEYAHNDYLQFLAEYGLVGAVIFLGGLFYVGFKLLRHEIFSRPHALFILMGLLMTMGHAWVDMPTACPAIFVTWAVLWVLLIRWIEFEDNRVRD